MGQMEFLDRMNRTLKIAGERVAPFHHLETPLTDYIATFEAVARVQITMDSVLASMGAGDASAINAKCRNGLLEVCIWVRDNVAGAIKVGDVYSSIANGLMPVEIMRDIAANTNLQNPELLSAIKFGYTELAFIAQHNWEKRLKP